MLEPRAVGGDQLFAAVGALLNETRALEHGQTVLLHGGEADLVARSKFGHRRRFRERPRQKMSRRVPSAKARKSWLSDSSLSFSLKYNHVVVR